ncbi:Hypothetical protein CKL_2590 [Clostridium kluyveri DSM 555]|uniref:Uncharacterized protein n=1 Tax=Clostridium kluyveri (strain ATCC 8527 / DSM 555 / NBRC 12016 / NCIMB 10680 / K1) TaxID=431943 RepID=A5N0F6_CLOK5|nr:Hypothetical protein CKL_2590 [Clostridium kluyveri DSM 555]
MNPLFYKEKNLDGTAIDLSPHGKVYFLCLFLENNFYWPVKLYIKNIKFLFTKWRYLNGRSQLYF